MAETFAELRALPDEELIRLHDHHAKSVQVATKHYLEELARREQDRATQTMLKLTQEVHSFTKQMRNMTIAILLATLVSIAVSIIALVKVS